MVFQPQYLYNVNFESSPKYLVNNKSNDTLKYFRSEEIILLSLDSILCLLIIYNEL